MNDDDRMDLVKAERYRAAAGAFELFRKDWEDGSGTTEHYMKKTKGELVKLMRDSSRFLVHQDAFLFDLIGEVTVLRSQMIASQAVVIKLQEELISCKNQQLESVQAAVKATVQETVHDTVKTEIKSFSQVVASSSPKVSLTPETLKKTVKDVVEQSDRSRNLMVFGLAEEVEEDIVSKLRDVFEELGEKPRVEACRVGAAVTGKVRAVKVTLGNAALIQQVLAKSRRLRHSSKYKDVFVCPDRTVDQREEQRKLVLELKRLVAANPEQRYFIKNGKICSAATSQS